MIQLTTGEMQAFNVLNNHVGVVQTELNQSMEARECFIGLLEHRYKAKYIPEKGGLEPLPKSKDK